MKLDHSWFTEIAADEGLALSLAGARRLHFERTPWQTIEVYETDTFGTLLVLDGCVMLTDRDHHFYHEMLAHPALFSHPAPRRAKVPGLRNPSPRKAGNCRLSKTSSCRRKSFCSIRCKAKR